MKITNKTVCIHFEHNVKVGTNGAIEATVEHQAWLYKDKNGIIEVDLEFVNVKDVKFLGMAIEGGYEGYRKFKAQMKELGIDVEQLIDNAAAELITDEDMTRLKSMYTF